MPPDRWPTEPSFVLPPLRGISTALGGKVISAVNCFIISRRFSDEFVAKAKVVELEEQTGSDARSRDLGPRLGELTDLFGQPLRRWPAPRAPRL
jgi:hypothetical protein